MARYLSQKQILEFRECFDLYDKRHHQKLSIASILLLLNSSANQNATIKPLLSPQHQTQNATLTISREHHPAAAQQQTPPARPKLRPVAAPSTKRHHQYFAKLVSQYFFVVIIIFFVVVVKNQKIKKEKYEKQLSPVATQNPASHINKTEHINAPWIRIPVVKKSSRPNVQNPKQKPKVAIAGH